MALDMTTVGLGASTESAQEHTDSYDQCQNSPRCLNTPSTFVKDAARNGFTPAQALALYHEKRFFLRHTVQAVGNPFQPSFLFLRIRDRVAQINKPEEWLQYVQIWAEGMYRIPTGEEKSPWWQCATEDEEEEIMAPLFKRMRNEMWAKGDKPPPEFMPRWTWMKVHQAIAKDLEANVYRAIPLRPRTATLAHVQKWMGRWMRRVGLSGVQWPWAVGNHVDRVWEIFNVLRQQQQRLTRITQWRGSVLGLGTNLWISIGLDLSSGGGGFFIPDAACPFIHLGWSGWPDTLPHEWFHGLDNLLAQSATFKKGHRTVFLASEVHDFSQERPWVTQSLQRLLCALSETRCSPQDYEAWCARWLKSGFARFFINPTWKPKWPLVLPLLLELSAHSPLSQRKLGRQGFFVIARAVQNNSRHIVDIVLPLVLESALAVKVALPWWERCDRAGELEFQRCCFMRRNQAAKKSAWWLRPSERLAMCFESQVRQWEVAEEDWRAPLLPTPEESALLKPHWDIFFNAWRLFGAP